MGDTVGNIHSIETCGTVDGPGIRFVLFLQGCPLRCQYCHNPDTWKVGDGEAKTVDEIFKEVVKYKSYMDFSGGGITATGGEPLLQAKFLVELFKRCKEKGIHTAIDTSGFILNDDVKVLLELTDLVILDIKHMDANQYKTITGVDLAPTLKFAKYLGELDKPTWIRYVLVPSLSDQLDSIEDLGVFIKSLPNVERVEILPFHKMGEFKWEELGYAYQLNDVNEPNRDQVSAAREILEKYHDHVYDA